MLILFNFTTSSLIFLSNYPEPAFPTLSHMTPRFSLKIIWGLEKILDRLVKIKISRIVTFFIRIVSSLLKHTYIRSSNFFPDLFGNEGEWSQAKLLRISFGSSEPPAGLITWHEKTTLMTWWHIPTPFLCPTYPLYVKIEKQHCHWGSIAGVLIKHSPAT